MADSFPLTAAVTPIDLAAYLLRNGVKVMGKPTPITDCKDGEIKISTNIYVQVGRGYALLVEESYEDDPADMEWVTGEMRYDGQYIIADIQATMNP